MESRLDSLFYVVKEQVYKLMQEKDVDINILAFNLGIDRQTLIEKFTNDIRFENLVGWYLKSLGARVDTPSKNESKTEDGDADKVGYFDSIKTAIMVQVKKHEGMTDDWAVQQIKAYKTNHNYGDYHTQMWVISTCEEFSKEAKSMAEEEEVRLINGIEFAKMILDAGLEGLNL